MGIIINSRPTSAINLHSTRNNNVTKFGTLSTDPLTSDRKESRLRIARPPANLISVSNSHWKQISSGTHEGTTKVTKGMVLNSQNAQNQYNFLNEKSKQKLSFVSLSIKILD